jgi:integrase/recombinase XerC
MLISPDIAAATNQWLGHLSGEKRLAAGTLEAYGRDTRQFFLFLAGYHGGAPKLEDLRHLKPTDIRAFLAERRREGIESRTLMRQLAALRSLFRYLEREGLAIASPFAAVRSPRIAKGLPRPLPPQAARALTDADIRLGEEHPQWVLVRDAAVLSLLYGSGLRIAEALSLRRKDAPGARDSLTITGKGRRGRCSSARKADRSAPASSSLRWPRCGARSACRKAPRRMRSGIPSPRICWRGAAISGPSRNCSAMRRCPRRRSIRRSKWTG